MENNGKKTERAISVAREEKITGGVKPLYETVLSGAAVCLALIAVFETAFLACFKETGLCLLENFGKAEVAARICAVFLATAALACGAVYEKKSVSVICSALSSVIAVARVGDSVFLVTRVTDDSATACAIECAVSLLYALFAAVTARCLVSRLKIARARARKRG